MKKIEDIQYITAQCKLGKKEFHGLKQVRKSTLEKIANKIMELDIKLNELKYLIG